MSDFNIQAFILDYKLKLMETFTSDQQRATFSQWYDETAPALAEGETSSREFTSAIQAAYKAWRANDVNAQAKILAAAWGISPKYAKYALKPKPVPPVVPEPEPVPVPATVERPRCILNGSQTCQVCASRPADGSLAKAEAMYKQYEMFVKKCLWREIRKYVTEGTYAKFGDVENDTWHHIAFEIAKYKPQMNPETGKEMSPMAWLSQITYWSVRTHFTTEWRNPAVQLYFDGNRGRSDGSWGYDARGKKKGAAPEDKRAVTFNEADIPFLA